MHIDQTHALSQPQQLLFPTRCALLDTGTAFVTMFHDFERVGPECVCNEFNSRSRGSALVFALAVMLVDIIPPAAAYPRGEEVGDLISSA